MLQTSLSNRFIELFTLSYDLRVNNTFYYRIYFSYWINFQILLNIPSAMRKSDNSLQNISILWIAYSIYSRYSMNKKTIYSVKNPIITFFSYISYYFITFFLSHDCTGKSYTLKYRFVCWYELPGSRFGSGLQYNLYWLRWNQQI